MSGKPPIEYSEIARLAIIGKGFDTYYIPSFTNVANARITSINEYDDEFLCMAGDVIVSRIRKDVPYLVDYYTPDN